MDKIKNQKLYSGTEENRSMCIQHPKISLFNDKSNLRDKSNFRENFKCTFSITNWKNRFYRYTRIARYIFTSTKCRKKSNQNFKASCHKTKFIIKKTGHKRNYSEIMWNYKERFKANFFRIKKTKIQDIKIKSAAYLDKLKAKCVHRASVIQLYFIKLWKLFSAKTKPNIYYRTIIARRKDSNSFYRNKYIENTRGQLSFELIAALTLLLTTIGIGSKLLIEITKNKSIEERKSWFLK